MMVFIKALSPFTLTLVLSERLIVMKAGRSRMRLTPGTRLVVAV
jgi:hypothetical protein